MFDQFLESSHRDDSDKWSNIGFGEEITQVESIEILRTFSGALIEPLQDVESCFKPTRANTPNTPRASCYNGPCQNSDSYGGIQWALTGLVGAEIGAHLHRGDF